MVKFQFSYLQAVKFYSSMKLSRSDPFRLYLMEKDNLGKGERTNETIFKSKG